MFPLVATARFSQRQIWPIGLQIIVAALVVSGLLLTAPTASGQGSSLFHQAPSGHSPLFTTQPPLVEMPGPAGAAGVMHAAGGPGVYPAAATVGLASSSWTYSPPPPRRTFRLHEIVTIRVDEIARVRAEGSAESRRNMFYDALLKDWVSLSGGKLSPATQADGEPRVNGQSTQLFRTNASLESREALTFSVAARVVDIQPNGNLVLEANKTIWFNDNQFETSLTGICRAQDIAPDNVVLSRDLVDLNIRKNEKGQLRDSYKRGWLTRWIGELNPF